MNRPSRNRRRALLTAATAATALVTLVTVWSPANAERAPGRSGAGSTTSSTPSTTSATPGSLGYDPSDTGSPSAITRIVGAQDAWAAGWTGAGVDVAVIDTGVARVTGLDAAGKVIDGPDLSFDSPGANPPGLDAHGHGTFMAGLIAGRDPGVRRDGAGCGACLGSSGYSDPNAYVGVAPDARVVNVKVGAVDGAVDVSQMIAAIHWVTQHAHDPGMNIRVLSLSYGTDSVQQYERDPLAQAAEQAWKHGIVVVVAAGNDGRGPRKVADPAYDPYVIAAGGQDPMGTLPVADDRVPDFAQHGTEDRPVDVIAPAAHVIGLRVPGSYVDTEEQTGGRVGTRFQRGSGTSQAAAIVAGGAALLAQKYPDATPDTIKGLLRSTAIPLPKSPQTPQNAEKYSGQGIVSLSRALAAKPSASPQSQAASAGDGTLEKARGGDYVTDRGQDLRGEQDIFGKPYDAAAMSALAARASAWTGGVWNGSRWTGDGWTGGRWAPADWTGTSWAGNAWTGSRWSGMSWDGSRWSGSGWNGSRWSGSRWSGSRWSTAGWE